MFSEPPNLNHIIFDLQLAGYTPVLAHPERYPYWHNNINKYDEIRSKGVLLQVNLLSFTGTYSPEVKKIAQKLVDKNWVDLCGTDAHNIQQLKMLESNLHLTYFHKLINLPLLNNTL
jgi:tyrosine-protein phosphatase YwqE